MKKLVPAWRSQKSSRSAASRTEKASRESSAAVNHPQTVSGRRSQVRPAQRQCRMVTRVLTADECRCDRKQRDAGEPEVHPEGLAGAGAGDGAEGWVGGPAGDGAAALDEGGGEQGEERDGGDPEGGGVHAREGHVAGAELAGQDEVAEASLGRGGEHEEDHQGAVEGDQREVVLGQDGAVEGDREVGPDQVDAHQQREHGADGDGDDGEQEVLEADDVVVGGEDVAAEPGERLRVELGKDGAAAAIRRW